MKIELDLPDWCDERHIRIMAGIEMVAYKLADEDKWHVKAVRCAKCGRCCMNLNTVNPDVLPNGVCKYLKFGKENICGLGINRPYVCSVSLSQKGRTEGCSIEYKWMILKAG